jgi:outer membrane lipoprotein-sorting protein
MTTRAWRRVLLRGTAVIALMVVAGVPAGAAPDPAPASAVAAATTSAPTRALTAEQIVEKHVAARGGLQKIRAIQTLRESGRMTEGPNREALVTRELKRPAQSRFEITLQGVTGVFVSDGTKGWKINPFDGDFEPKPLPEAAIREAAEQADIEGPLVDWKAKGHIIALAGRESVNGRDAFKIQVTLKSGGTRNEYIDAKTFQRVRSDSTRTVKGHAVQITATFGDYKKSGGVAFPHTVEISASGRPQKMRVVVDKIEVNPTLPADRFAMVDLPKP